MQLKQFKFERLQVWDLAMDYGEKIQKVSTTFPPKELYNLQSQINRAADSIALNISEGATGNSNPRIQKVLRIFYTFNRRGRMLPVQSKEKKLY